MKKMEISKERLAELEKAEAILSALQAGGVDNWDGYDFAMEEFRRDDEIDALIERTSDDIVDVACESNVDQPAGPGCGYRITPDEAQIKALLRGFLVHANSVYEKYK